MSHPADDIVKSAYAPPVQADEYLLPATPPTGALIKADNPKLVLEALKDGKIRLTCSTWEDARVLLPGQMLGVSRESTFWIVSRLETASLTKGFTMTFQLQADIKQAAHDIRQRFDQVETVTKAELAPMLAKLHGLVAKLPGDVEGAEAEVESEAKITVTEARAGVEAAVAKARGEATDAMKAMQSGLEEANSKLAVKAAEVEALEAKLAAALKPAPSQVGTAGGAGGVAGAPSNPAAVIIPGSGGAGDPALLLQQAGTQGVGSVPAADPALAATLQPATGAAPTPGANPGITAGGQDPAQQAPAAATPA